jgi:hypothetical protein
MKIILLIAMLFGGVVQSAQQPPADATFERLAKVSTFAFGGVGFAGTISEGEKDYDAIRARATALADFERLYETGNTMAKAYALVGIHELDAKGFKVLADAERGSAEKIDTMQGCIVSHETFGDVVKQIEAGRYSHLKKAISR